MKSKQPRKKVFVIGQGPLFGEGETFTAGTSLRTWQFVGPLLEAGHEVQLHTVPITGYNDEFTEVLWKDATYRGLAYRQYLSNNEERLAYCLRLGLEELKPDVIVAVNSYPAFVVAKVNPAIPFWADQNGWALGEGLARAHAVKSLAEFGHFWRIEALPLLRADAISTVSRRQSDAVLAQMAILGRFDGTAIGTDFVHPAPTLPDERFTTMERRSDRPAILEGKVPAEANFALWSGAFNCWSNPDYFADALEILFARDKELHVVCTGGAVAGHDEATYARFLSHAKDRLPTNRLHLLGWIDFETVYHLHQTTIMGLSVDWPNLETRFGARIRLTSMVGAGIPVVSTAGSEVADWIGSLGAGFAVDPTRPEDYAEAICTIAADPEEWRRRAAVGREAYLTSHSSAHIMAPFLDWVANPRLTAPGKGAPVQETPAARLRRWVEFRASMVGALDGLDPVPTPLPNPVRSSLADRLRRAIARRLRRLKGA